MMRRSNPFREFDELFERMNQQFGEMSRGVGSEHGIEIDIADYDGEIVVTADLPGYEKADIDISLDERSLRLTVTHEATNDDEAGEYIRRERHHESMQRTIQLPVEVDEDGASATYQNGVLSITLPKLVSDDEDESYHIDVN